MMHSDEDKSEQLWQQIEEIKRAGNAAPTRQDLNRARNGAGLNGLNALSQAVYATLQAETEAPRAQEAARFQLNAAMQTEQAAPSPGPDLPTQEGKALRPPFRFRNRQTLLIALLLLAIAGACFALWYESQDTCQPPAVSLLQPPSLLQIKTTSSLAKPACDKSLPETLPAETQERVAGIRSSTRVR